MITNKSVEGFLEEQNIIETKRKKEWKKQAAILSVCERVSI